MSIVEQTDRPTDFVLQQKTKAEERELYSRAAFFVGALLVVWSIVMLYTGSINVLGVIQNSASNATIFSPTHYVIYDRSTKTVCDRLICVKPFEWWIYAKNGSVLVFDVSGYLCPQNMSAALVVPTTVTGEVDETYSFKNICVHKTLSNLIAAYQNFTTYTIDYSIPKIQTYDNSFTVLDALNDLFTKYITQSVDSSSGLTHQQSLEKTFETASNRSAFMIGLTEHSTRLDSKFASSKRPAVASKKSRNTFMDRDIANAHHKNASDILKQRK